VCCLQNTFIVSFYIVSPWGRATFSWTITVLFYGRRNFFEQDAYLFGLRVAITYVSLRKKDAVLPHHVGNKWSNRNYDLILIWHRNEQNVILFYFKASCRCCISCLTVPIHVCTFLFQCPVFLFVYVFCVRILFNLMVFVFAMCLLTSGICFFLIC